ncbi:cytochrome P450 [Metschnikowia bicuspidata var. bicuspidata NRRL YB-4993]|uniref:Cytochrome P450 n=1 Tax=Metschnikowia bicuspidata var. bicuspidata NRRL YB-4993 TaxID=869754 RepID=A0A1A0HK18_9ASCO|nr:cytochrome P450 [Metschnikowia bicuspidata var. bicuspidata NRRL YB-4993]OBA24524.1 cytochrome P450 [Metschnikowia bicuspidata var. bicuspidata NRRL YB-4993]
MERSIHKSQSHIHGGFLIPGYPLVGNTFQVLNNPSKTFMDWCTKYKHNTFVIHLGSIPVVIVNSRKDIEYIWSHHPTSLNSRPALHTFHHLISATQGPTIGTTPAGASFRRKRKFLSLCLSAQSLSTENYVSAIEKCSEYVIGNLLTLSESAHVPFPDVSLLRDFQCYVLRCAIMLTYGICLDTQGKDNFLADKIIQTENHIINFRSYISNYQDYLPILRLCPFSNFFQSEARIWKSERDEYINYFQSEFEKGLQNNNLSQSDSILAKILSQRSNAKTLTHQEARSICLTMISAGLDNLGYTMNYIIGQFSSSRRGYRMQEKLFHELLAKSDNNIIQAWNDSVLKIDCDLALAIIQEALRNFSVLPLGLPRLKTKPLRLGNLTIPKDTVLFMNVFSANHDPQYFSSPNYFNPQRWLDEEGKLKGRDSVTHYTFGLGSRKCAGDQLSLREMYSLLCRIVLTFHIGKPRNKKWNMEPDAFRSNLNPAATSIEPKEFRISLRTRQSEGLDELHLFCGCKEKPQNKSH